MNTILGIDIGGTGIKGAIVDVDTGLLVTKKHRIDTPQPATPDAVTATVKQIVSHFDWKGPVGCGFPAAIQQGVIRTAANISSDWLNVNAEELFSAQIGLPFKMLNDADAAGMAEMRCGAGKGVEGVVMMVTLGTGIGSALFSNGHLQPNTELGHLELHGMKVEHYASNAVRKKQDLDWKEWSSRLNEVLNVYSSLFWPDLFIIGGGVSKKHAHFFPLLESIVPIVAAQRKNKAGMIGAAIYSFEHFNRM